ncbi:MAG: RNA methyltransferase [Clostridiales bacterium]|nr:RNA methyltransferase [Clostridiales bacterium]
MERITSRKNRIISHFRNLASVGEYRHKTGEFICDGEKTLREALMYGSGVTCVLWEEEPAFELEKGIEQYCCPNELIQYVSPLKNSQGPVFSVKIPQNRTGSAGKPKNVIVLENVQDPGNVGTVIRTANAMGIDMIVLVGNCTDLYNPKTVRATMGAVFRQQVAEMTVNELKSYVNQNGLRLYGAALNASAEDVRNVNMKNLAVAVGSEGKGLSEELLSICDGQLIIPMQPDSESLNVAVAASIIMWEMRR